MSNESYFDRQSSARRFQAELLKFYATDEASGQLSGSSFLRHRLDVQNELTGYLEDRGCVLAQQQPVCRFLDAILSTPPLPTFSGLIRSIRELSPYLCWKLNESYRNVFSDHFFENESFTEVIGPDGLLYNKNMRAGLLLLGEEVDYPAHKHEATEWYNIIAGSGLWQQGNSNYQARVPGSAIFHSEWEAHAMRCNGQPILALWTWSGELDSEAVVNPGDT